MYRLDVRRERSAFFTTLKVSGLNYREMDFHGLMLGYISNALHMSDGIWAEDAFEVFMDLWSKHEVKHSLLMKKASEVMAICRNEKNYKIATDLIDLIEDHSGNDFRNIYTRYMLVLHRCSVDKSVASDIADIVLSVYKEKFSGDYDIDQLCLTVSTLVRCEKSADAIRIMRDVIASSASNLGMYGILGQVYIQAPPDERSERFFRNSLDMLETLQKTPTFEGMFNRNVAITAVSS